MNLQLAVTGTATRRRRYLRRMVIAGGVAFTLVATFAGGFWWSTAREDVGTNPATSQATSTEIEAVTTPGGVSRIPSSTYHLYLTSSQDEAEVIRRLAVELNALLLQSGQRPVEGDVLVMNDLDTSVLEMLPRPPDTILVDLRTP